MEWHENWTAEDWAKEDARCNKLWEDMERADREREAIERADRKAMKEFIQSAIDNKQ